jgi:hypothetical protein
VALAPAYGTYVARAGVVILPRLRLGIGVRERGSALTVIFTGCASARLVPPILDELFSRGISLSA